MDKHYLILCVDDEPIILKTLERALKPEGYDIITALNGEEALALLDENPVNLIIADQRMPKMTGSEFLRKTRDKYPDIIRIMLSGYSDFNGLVKAVNEGEIFRFLSKPWQNEELREVVKLAFEQKNTLAMVKEVLNNISAAAQVVEGMSIEIVQEQSFIDLKISEEGKLFSEEAVFKFLNLIFDSFGIGGDKIRMVSGAITKHHGRVVFKINVGKGVALRISMPNTIEDKAEQGA